MDLAGAVTAPIMDACARGRQFHALENVLETGPETTCVGGANAAFAAATFGTHARWNPGGAAEALATALLTAAVAATGELAVDIAAEMAPCAANLAEIASLSVFVTELVVVVAATAPVASGPLGTLASGP